MKRAASRRGESTGLGVGYWGKGPRGPAGDPQVRGLRGPPGNQHPAGEEGARARPHRGCWGRVGEGRPRASHNNKSQPLPTPTSKSEALANPGGTYSGRGSLRAPRGCGVGGWGVYRSFSPAAPFCVCPPPLLAPARSLPVPLPLRQMASGCPAPSCPTGWLPAIHFAWLLEFAAGVCLVPRGSPLYSVSCRFFACRLHDLGLYLSFSRSSLNSALMSPQSGEDPRDNVA